MDYDARGEQRMFIGFVVLEWGDYGGDVCTRMRASMYVMEYERVREYTMKWN